jgi:hypothetical protein
MENQDIDFVITWVDGNDPEWQREKNKYLPELTGVDKDIRRYRDWQLLKFWFRGVEKFAPWVRKIFFVTWGHTPKWLNINHEKLEIVNHSDFIPSQYLPTFNSNTIDLCLHRIPSLSERFVYFNDDTFLINKIRPDDFFQGSLPCEQAILGVVKPHDEPVDHIMFNDLKIINRYFRKSDLTIRQWRKLFCFCYGKLLVRTLCLLPFDCHTGFYNHHLPLSLTREMCAEVWNKVPEELADTCSHRFRSFQDYNIWLIRYWQLAKGAFMPHGMNGKYFEIGDTRLFPYVYKQKGKMVCCNDVRENIDFESEKKALVKSFMSILPEKSGFEK